MRSPSPLLVPALAALLALAAGPAAAQDEPRPRPGLPGVPDEGYGALAPDGLGETFDEALEGLEALESWIVLREDAAPDPPLVRVGAGAVVFFDLRSEVQSDRGTVLDDLEEEQGLPASGVAPWLSLSIGRVVRGGAEVLWLRREGDLTVQDAEVVFDGRRLAGPGELVEARFDVLTCAGFVEWDALLGSTYRFGLLGGLRYFAVDVRLRGVRANPTMPVESGRERGELVSPFFGGVAELTPFPAFSVAARVQFMNWAWSAVGLKDARFLEFSLGAMFHVLPGRLGLGVEYRYLFARAETVLEDEGGQQFQAGVSGTGVALTLLLEY